MFKETTNYNSPSSKLSTKLSECSLIAKTPNRTARSTANRSHQHAQKSPSTKLRMLSFTYIKYIHFSVKNRSLTPSRNANYCGVGATGGDRYIPTRSDTQFELASFHMSSSIQPVETVEIYSKHLFC